VCLQRGLPAARNGNHPFSSLLGAFVERVRTLGPQRAVASIDTQNFGPRNRTTTRVEDTTRQLNSAENTALRQQKKLTLAPWSESHQKANVAEDYRQ